MFSELFHGVVYNPIYNGLVFFVDKLPSHDVGLAVILVTIVVRVILYPLARSAIQTQMKMKEVAPEVEELKKKFKSDQQEQTKALLALYRERGIRPFSSFFLVLLQLPVLIGLYLVFARGGLPTIDPSLLYTLVPVPEVVNMEFLGLIDMGERSITLAALAALTQFVYTRLSMGPRGQLTATEASFSADMAKAIDVQMRFALPLFIGVIGYTISAAAPLYWVTGNLFMIGQELLSGRRFNGKNGSKS